MQSTATSPRTGGLLRSRTTLTTASARNMRLGDGGGTGKGDGND